MVVTLVVFVGGGLCVGLVGFWWFLHFSPRSQRGSVFTVYGLLAQLQRNSDTYSLVLRVGNYHSDFRV